MKRSSLLQIASAVFLLLAGTAAWCDTSMLHPPKGHKVAIIVFEDMECPMCARVAPLLHQASEKYNIPLVQHDFPLRQHPWSYDAAINARYFDTKSAKLGDEYRLYILQNQNFITKQNLRGVTEKWAQAHGTTFPFVVDPTGELALKIQADQDLGMRIPLDHTPTIFIVNDSGHGAAVTEVTDINQLYQTLDQVTQEAAVGRPGRKTAGAH